VEVFQYNGQELEKILERQNLYNDRGLLAENQYKVSSTVLESKQDFYTQLKYNDFGEMSYVVYPDGYQLQHGYDEFGRLLEVSGKMGATGDFQSHIRYSQFAGFGSATTLEYGNGIETHLSYRRNALGAQLGKIEKVQTRNASGTMLLDRDYTLNGFDEIIAMKDAVKGLGGEDKSFSYAYDNAGQLIEANGPWGKLEYQYSSHGVMQKFEDFLLEVEKSQPQRPQYKKDATGKVVEEYGYTLDGHRSFVKDFLKKKTTYYSWDADGRLVSVCEKASCDKEGSVLVAQYVYDETGERVLKGKNEKADTLYLGKIFEIRFTSQEQWVKHIFGADGSRVASLYSKAGFGGLNFQRNVEGIKNLLWGGLENNLQNTTFGLGSGSFSAKVSLEAPLALRMVSWSLASVVALLMAGVLFGVGAYLKHEALVLRNSMKQGSSFACQMALLLKTGSYRLAIQSLIGVM